MQDVQFSQPLKLPQKLSGDGADTSTVLQFIDAVTQANVAGCNRVSSLLAMHEDSTDQVTDDQSSSDDV